SFRTKPLSRSRSSTKPGRERPCAAWWTASGSPSADDRSWRSSVAEGRFATFLLASLRALEDEVPRIHTRLCRILAPRDTVLHVDGETIHLRFTGGGIEHVQHAGRDAIELRTSRRTILALVAGETSLVDALLDDQMALLGDPDDVLVFHDGL